MYNLRASIWTRPDFPEKSRNNGKKVYKGYLPAEYQRRSRLLTQTAAPDIRKGDTGVHPSGNKTS
jgi:hypothetical protein